jgi:rubrerythrin
MIGATMALYAALLAPIAWRVPGHAARMLHGFARAEQGSAIDLLAAANLSPSPARRALYLRHALDEKRHATMFARRASELRRAGGEGSLGPASADTEQLFERLGEIGFLAFVHLGEARATADLAVHARTCQRRGDARSAALFEAILGDEARHAAYTTELLAELAGGPREARRAIRQARLWEAWRLWRRAGRTLATGVYQILMIALFVLCAPLAIVIRLARPARAGWTGEGSRHA